LETKGKRSPRSSEDLEHGLEIRRATGKEDWIE
jgi:hypothetical protein